MPQIVQLPAAENSSLSRLGDIILGSSANYANQKRQTDREAELRAQQLADQATARGNQLADVASARQYETATHDTRRQEGLQDSVTQMENQFKAELMRLGYKVDTAEDYAAARADFQKSELYKRYAEALADGSLTHADFGDAAKMAAGLAKHDARVGSIAQSTDTNRANAGTVATNLANDRAKLIQAANELDRKLSEPAPQPTPQQIEALATQTIIANTPAGQKPVINDQTMATARLAAADKLREQLILPWSQMKQQQSIQRQLIESRLKDISAEMNTQANRFGVVGIADPSVSAPAMQPAPQAAVPNLAAARQSFASTLGGAQPQPTPVATPTPQRAQPVAAPTPAPQAATVPPFPGMGTLQGMDLPMVQQGRNRTFGAITPEVLDRAEKAAQDEINQMFARGLVTSTQANGVNGDRLHQLRGILADIAQRRQDQLNTIQARSSLAAPVSTATDTVPRAPAVNTGWWNPAVGNASVPAPTY